MARRTIILAIPFLALLAFGAAARVSPLAAGTGLLLFGVMAGTGVVLLARAFPCDRSGLELLVFGSVFGLILGRLGLVFTGIVLGAGAGSVWATLVGMAVLAAVVRRGSGSGVRLTDGDCRELPGLALIGTCVLATMAVAFYGVARETPQGYAFVPYFNWDFLQHVSTTAELSRAIPPENQCFAGERLHYYWFYHVWPSAIEKLSGVTAKDALVASLVLNNLLFVASLLLVMRAAVPGRWPRAVAVLAGVVAYSYIGLAFEVAKWVPKSVLRIPNFSHSSGYSQLSHSWFRDFLYEPHAVCAMTFVLLAIFLHRRHRDTAGWRAGAITGLGLAGALWTDAFVGLTGGLWYAALAGAALLRERTVRPGTVACGLVAVATVGAAVLLGVFPLRGNLLGLGLHPTAKLAPFYLTVELGPIFLLGTAGLVIALRRPGAAGAYGGMIVLTAICLAFAFLVRNPQEPNLVLRKAIKVVQIPLVLFTSVAIAWAFEAGRRRTGVRILAAGVLAAGTVTLGTDLSQYTNLLAQRNPPTSYLSPSEMDMLAWIRANTPATAVLQDLGQVRPDRSRMDTWDLKIPALAERRALFANYTQPYIFQVPRERIDSRRRELEEVSQADTAPALRTALEHTPSCWLYLRDDDSVPAAAAVGELRREGYLTEVHRVAGVSLLARAPSPPSAAAAVAAGQNGQAGRGQ